MKDKKSVGVTKAVVITGGSRGIGAATAKLFAKNDYRVCIVYKSNDEAARATCDEIRLTGGNAFIIKADVANENEVVQLFQTLDEQLPQIDVLINNVGVLQAQCRLTELTAERINHILTTNVTSYFLCCREAVKRMSTALSGRGGTIVNVSSGAAKTGSPNEYTDYAASKGAIDTLTKGLAMEVAQEGIRVNGVRPGLIYTDMHADGGEPNRVNRLKDKLPLQRGGSPEEVANAIYYLANEDSSFTTGSMLDVAGGL